MNESRPNAMAILRERGYRVTPQRLKIYNALWNAGSHPTVIEVHQRAIKEDPTISKATVYKTLQLFTEIGLAVEMGFRDESTRYDPEVDGHINLICTQCGSVEDYDGIDLSSIKNGVEKGMKFKIFAHRFEVHGLCSKCQAK
ncbi:MAG: Fur family transcriptional regulator [Candidatus Thorarchaeota archaeon]|nr:Fur family transcriptional regulator [Candidatus Thorarchaeota archaeon]